MPTLIEKYTTCFACGSMSPDIQGETHQYMLSSPGCWSMFGDVLSREYANPAYSTAHNYTVDAYALQHSGSDDDLRAIKSINIHLASLYAVFIKDIKITEADAFKATFSQFYKSTNELTWLVPPSHQADLTIADLWRKDNATEHLTTAQCWANSVWKSWEHHHERISWLVGKMGI